MVTIRILVPLFATIRRATHDTKKTFGAATIISPMLGKKSEVTKSTNYRSKPSLASDKASGTEPHTHTSTWFIASRWH